MIVLRHWGLAQLIAMGLAPVRIPGRRELYRLSDGSIVQLRTNARGRLLGTATSADPNSPIDLEEGGHDVIAVFPDAMFRIPAERSALDMREYHAEHFTEHPPINAEHARRMRMRVLTFGGDPARLGMGFAVKYAEYRLELPAEVPALPTSDEPLQLALRHVGDVAVNELGVPPESVTISVAVQFRSAQFVYRWNAATGLRQES